MHHSPLVKRVFKYKNPTARFYCPLCRSERAFTLHYRLSFKNYCQVAMTSAFLMLFLYPVMELKSLWVVFVVWGAFELSVRWLFRRQIPCPHCGFDASWYRKDVKMARRLVERFWQPEEGASDANEVRSTSNEKKEPKVPEITPNDASLYLD